MADSGHIEKVIAHAEDTLIPDRREAKSRAAMLKHYRAFIKKENHRIRLLHRAGGSGLEVAGQRSKLIDFVMSDLYSASCEDTSRKRQPTFTILANGGYGRGYLNPGSDIDLLFLLPHNSRRITAEDKEIIEEILMMLYDVGFKVGHAVRSIAEACKFANSDHQTKTSLLDARFIVGDAELVDEFIGTFRSKCIDGSSHEYLEARTLDIRARHEKYHKTIHLQEPNVKEGCGGLRDYHNLMWVIYVLRNSRDLDSLVKEGLLTLSSKNEIEAAYEFLMRVRNSLHYAQKRSVSDILTLRLQGRVATAAEYPGRTIVRRTEVFMREYYRHTRNLYQHSTSVMQSLELEVEDNTTSIPILSFLANRLLKTEMFDGFYSKDGLIYPETDTIFEEDPRRMMRAFLHTQQRSLSLSPPIRKLYRKSAHLINHGFRVAKANRETFEEILRNRGQVGQILRQMHRVGFLGKYLPEFGELTDLVQHEFFHRYTADEHTLRCIDQLDRLATSDDPKEQHFKMLLQDIEDPSILYLALIMHDTGRAENVRVHEDASAMLASKVASRLRIQGDRLTRLIFLVDHHLTFWRTATTQNLDDPDVIETFAKAMRNKRSMQALYLFTYVDSRGTNEEAWNDWKAMLMRQLYQNASAYLTDQKVFTAEAQRARISETKERVLAKVPKYTEEIEAHFENMPMRYFRYRGATSIIRHLKQVHRFLKIFAKDPQASLIPQLSWEARPAEGYSLVEVTAWSHSLLIAKVAGALSARGLNILSADFFTRSDSIVIDSFRVCTTNLRPVTNEREKERVEALIRVAFDPGLEADPEELRALIAKANEAAMSAYLLDPDYQIPQRVLVSNTISPEFTVLEVQARDRIGLLYELLLAVGRMGIEVVNARISTQAGAAIDRLYLSQPETPGKIEDAALLKTLESTIADIVATKPVED